MVVRVMVERKLVVIYFWLGVLVVNWWLRMLLVIIDCGLLFLVKL